jgi:hypothetical protein
MVKQFGRQVAVDSVRLRPPMREIAGPRRDDIQLRIFSVDRLDRLQVDIDLPRRESALAHGVALEPPVDYGAASNLSR